MKLIKSNSASAIVISIVFAVVLLQLAIIYTLQVRESRPQTEQIDERIRLRYLAHGLTEIALLKLQRFPADYYHVWEYGKDEQPYKDFTYMAEEFAADQFDNESDQPASHFNNNTVRVTLDRMELSTASDTYWTEQVFVIRAIAEYQDRRGRHVNTDAVRTVKSSRQTLKAQPVDPDS